jgi:hypothetical protein
VVPDGGDNFLEAGVSNEVNVREGCRHLNARHIAEFGYFFEQGPLGVLRVLQIACLYDAECNITKVPFKKIKLHFSTIEILP